jgi:hypothetical protein
MVRGMPLVDRPDGSQVRKPIDRCEAEVFGQACGDTSFSPGWGRCPSCAAMTFLWRCDRGHQSPDTDHEHREVPPERPRWNCGYEDWPSSSSK